MARHPDWTIKKYVRGSAASECDLWERDKSSSLAQQRTDFTGRVINFDLEPRISRLQLPTRCFSSLDSVELCLEVAVDDRREPFGGRPVGSLCLPWPRLVN